MDADESRQGELTSSYLYRLIAARESDPRRKRLFEGLARDAQAHAGRLGEARACLGIGACAGALTYLLGTLLGVSLG